jgi:hypothetical protein
MFTCCRSRTVTAWCAAGAGLLNRNTLRIDTSTASTTDGYVFDFDKSWVALPGSDQPIDVATLPVIEQPEIVEMVAADTPAVSNRADDPAFKNYRTPEIDALCKAQQDACDKEARRICANNLERELRRERREGAAYVPASEINFGTRR